MAIINCPDCGREISDKSKTCIHCGKIFVQETQIIEPEVRCTECGAVLADTDAICPNCGCPVEQKKDAEGFKPEQVEASSIQNAAKPKKIVIAIVAAICICIVGGVGYKIYADNKAKQEYQQAYEDYVGNLKKIKQVMLSGGSDAEDLCNLTLKVWGNSIFETADAETDPFTRPNGYFVDDFNTALQYLFLDSETRETISDIKENQDAVKELIKKLQTPPEELSNCYDTVSELYSAYKTLTDLAINPSGNYSGFSDSKRSAVSDFLESYETLDNQIPEETKDE